MRIVGLPSGGKITTNTIHVSTFKIIHIYAIFTVPPMKKQRKMIIFQYATAACP